MSEWNKSVGIDTSLKCMSWKHVWSWMNARTRWSETPHTGRLVKAHTHLVFVDALRAEHFGLSDQIKNTWVECRKNGMTYREFFSNEAAILQDARLQPYKDNDGESWRRKETGQQCIPLTVRQPSSKLALISL